MRWEDRYSFRDDPTVLTRKAVIRAAVEELALMFGESVVPIANDGLDFKILDEESND